MINILLNPEKMFVYDDNIKTVYKAGFIHLRRPVFPQVTGLNHLNKHKYHSQTTLYYISKVPASSFITSNKTTFIYQILMNKNILYGNDLEFF